MSLNEWRWSKFARRYRPVFLESRPPQLIPPQRSAISFHARFTQGGAYTDLTAEATARAIQAKAQGAYRVTISVDGLNRVEGRIFATRLRTLGIGPRKIRGVRNEKSDAGIRLADALCGLVRDAEEEQDWARDALEKLQKNGYMKEV